MSTYTYPHTIENGGGERLTFLRRVPGSAGDRLEVENTVKPGSGPPMHVHHLQEEALTVEAGRIGYERPGEPAQFAEAGETVVFKAGEWHRFWNPGKRTSGARATSSRPTTSSTSSRRSTSRSERTTGAARTRSTPHSWRGRYRTEFGMAVMPGVLQRVLFPLLDGVGRLLGKHAKYEDAPEPVRR